MFPSGNVGICERIQARMAQLVAYQLGTGEVPGSNPGQRQHQLQEHL